MATSAPRLATARLSWLTAGASGGPRAQEERRRSLVIYVCLLIALVAEGIALAHSYMWAAPLVGLLVVALAVDVPLVPVVGVVFAVRVLTSAAISSPRAQLSTSLNLSGLIAVLFILLAAGLLLRRRQAMMLAGASSLWLVVWSFVAASMDGFGTLAFREGVREASIVAVALIVWNARGAFTVANAVRIVQIAGVGAALLAIYQFATHTGLNIEGQIRSNGTFTHPNGASMYFAIAVTASLWRYLDYGRRPLDAALTCVYAAATITTFSVGGLVCLFVMLMTFGALRPGSLRLKLGSGIVAALIVVGFMATPLGAKRLSAEAETHLSATQTRVGVNSTFAWRIYKWRTLIPEWERDPFFGHGLGYTVAAEGTIENTTSGKQPHNEYVRYIVETGVVGFMTLLWGIGTIFRRLVRHRRKEGMLGVGALGIAVLVGCLLNSFVDNTILYTTTGYEAALIIAAVFIARPGVSPTRSD